MQLAIFDDNRRFAEIFQFRLAEKIKEFAYSCQCIMITDLDILFLTDLSAIDALFLGVDIPCVDGIDIAFAIREKYPNLIIVLISEKLDYAPDGYRLSAFRYLLKARLEQDFEQCISDVINVILADKKTLKISGKCGVDEVYLDEVIYFEGTSRRMVRIHTTRTVIECKGRLSDYAAELTGRGFLRIQRSFLVNLQHILDIKNYWVILSNGELLKTSVQNYSEICTKFRQWKENA